ncbi:hypothetical protein [Streptomyces nigrescens]|uniref:Core-binding (CB) domain-containing protein n=1 Tax=Streptomyces nigrescens TaxID=1920 RepID=A0ABY7IY44_STRNI|nr:hypothetical protein [Streptomyces nigrescens]WAU03729.1 hypothetical protein STRNI_001896 [Streptomyces nigrescens]
MDDELGVIEEADRFLREFRLARGRAETTTKAYAEALVLFLLWCLSTKRDWRTAARDMGLFMLWLKWTPGNGGQRRVVVPGPGSRPVRGEIRINKALSGVRMFLVHAVMNKAAPAWVLEQIYELGDDRGLPEEARGESGGMRYRMRARHWVQEPETEVDRASDEEVVAMFLKCRSARDRLILRARRNARRRRITYGSSEFVKSRIRTALQFLSWLGTRWRTRPGPPLRSDCPGPTRHARAAD